MELLMNADPDGDSPTLRSFRELSALEPQDIAEVLKRNQPEFYDD
jgi:hypothetical protein